MTVRIVSPVYTCECNGAMMFLDGPELPRRTMTCCGKTCKNKGVVVLEPVFTVDYAPVARLDL